MLKCFKPIDFKPIDFGAGGATPPPPPVTKKAQGSVMSIGIGIRKL